MKEYGNIPCIKWANFKKKKTILCPKQVMSFVPQSISTWSDTSYIHSTSLDIAMVGVWFDLQILHLA